MNALLTHNTLELPFIVKLWSDEWHLMQEAFKDLDENAPDVISALTERVAELTIEQGQRMADLVD